MKCIELDSHFRNSGHWVNWNKTTDIFTFGNPHQNINKIAVAWKPTLSALKEAFTKDVNFFISHESIAVKARNGSMKPDIDFMLRSEKMLFDFLAKSNLTVYRCHDFLDAVPEWGVMYSWQKGLELDGKIKHIEYPNIITQIKSITVEKLAKHIISKTSGLGQEHVLISGNPDKIISTVATGTGCAHNIDNVRKHGADISIVVDDAYNSVRMGSHMRDCDYPMIILNHGVTEEWAVKNLAAHLNKSFPQIETLYIPQRCTYHIT